jgi:type I restriction enzyme S subunit
LADVLREPLINGRSVKTLEGGFPVLRLTALKRGGIDLSERKEGAWTAEEAAPFLVAEGDFLLSRGNGSRHLVGRGAAVRKLGEPCAFPDTMIRVRTRADVVLDGYLREVWDSPVVRRQIEAAARTTAGIYKVNQEIIEGIELPLPPLAEQHRIVDALEDHLSRLDAAIRDVAAARKKVAAFRKAALLSLVPFPPPASWEVTTVEDAGKVELGRQRHPDWHHGPDMRPYLRVANVFEDLIDTSDVMEMDFSGVFDRFRLHPGDVLLNEGQSPHLVGRPALYRGEPPNVAFTNSLLRFQARPGVLPEWALMVFRRHLHARRFMQEVRITTNIAHLSSKRLKAVEFPIPPVEEQQRRIAECDELMSYADAMNQALLRNSARSAHLKNALLHRAFTGRLVPQNPDDEPASVLLDRIRAERAAQSVKPQRKRRAPAKAGGTAGPSPAPEANPIPADAVQQELPL